MSRRRVDPEAAALRRLVAAATDLVVSRRHKIEARREGDPILRMRYPAFMKSQQSATRRLERCVKALLDIRGNR